MIERKGNGKDTGMKFKGGSDVEQYFMTKKNKTSNK